MSFSLGPRLKDALVLLAIAAFSCGVAGGLFMGLPFLRTMETWLMDFRVATLLPPEPQHPDIIIAGITEDTLAQFPYRSPVDRAFVADLIQTLEEKGARAILLDVLLDQSTEPEKDAALKRVLEESRIPLVVSYGGKDEGLTEKQQAYLNDFVPLRLRGFANLQKDGFDGVARWTFKGKNLPDGTFLPGVAAIMVARLGYPAPQLGDHFDLAYRGRPDTATTPFRQFPAHMVKVLPAKWFKDKIVLVGADLSDRDRHATPFRAASSGMEGVQPGVVIHAHSIGQLLDGRLAPGRGMAVALVTLGMAGLLGMLLGRVEIALWMRGLIGLVLMGLLWVGGFALFRYSGQMIPLMSPTVALGIAIWMTDIYTGRKERDQRKFIQQAFSKYLSPALLDEIVKDPSKLSLDPKRREMSFIFTDVAGFTTISESMEAAQLADVMNRYLDGVVKVVFSHGGTVDKFIGDAVFAIFNAPKDQDDHAVQAARCGLAIDAFSEAFLASEIAAGRNFGMTRIGVHTGSASIGNFGAAERFEYTALGDAVNTAARLEGMNKYFGTRVALSGANARLCQGIAMRPIGRVVLKGKTEPIDVFEPLAGDEDGFAARYCAAYALMDAGDAAAIAAFAALVDERPDDGPSALHAKRMAQGEVSSIIVMTDK